VRATVGQHGPFLIFRVGVGQEMVSFVVSAWVAVEDLISHWLVDDDLAGELI
jgi:hypothetical protein